MSGSDRSTNPFHMLLGLVIVIVVAVAGFFFLSIPPRPPSQDPQIQEARQLVAKWADKLDRQTTDAGVYIRWPNATLPEDDPWGRPLVVEYSQGGVAEHVSVRSFGRDGVDRTFDDVVATRHAVNLKGIGEGVKKNAAETTKNAAKGAVKGIVEGAKEAVGK
jgi:hypothetical protein